MGPETPKVHTAIFRQLSGFHPIRSTRPVRHMLAVDITFGLNPDGDKSMKRKVLLAAAFLAASIPSYAQAADIVETAISTGKFNTLVAAVKAAGLVETFGDGPITVFAPTDDAFA